jgi:DNA-binding Lrp family transcriptional regulator
MVLKELNDNGREDFTDVDRRCGLNEGTSYYTFHKLSDERLIWRMTLSMERLPIKYTAAFVVRQTVMHGFEHARSDYVFQFIKNVSTTTNRYVLAGDIGSPYGTFYLAPAYSEQQIELLKEESMSVWGRFGKLETAIVTNILVGSLGFRNIDYRETHQYVSGLYKEPTAVETSVQE